MNSKKRNSDALHVDSAIELDQFLTPGKPNSEFRVNFRGEKKSDLDFVSKKKIVSWASSIGVPPPTAVTVVAKKKAIATKADQKVCAGGWGKNQ